MAFRIAFYQFYEFQCLTRKNYSILKYQVVKVSPGGLKWGTTTTTTSDRNSAKTFLTNYITFNDTHHPLVLVLVLMIELVLDICNKLHYI